MTLITQNISPNEMIKTLILLISGHVHWKHMGELDLQVSADTTLRIDLQNI